METVDGELWEGQESLPILVYLHEYDANNSVLLSTQDFAFF